MGITINHNNVLPTGWDIKRLASVLKNMRDAQQMFDKIQTSSTRRKKQQFERLVDEFIITLEFDENGYAECRCGRKYNNKQGIIKEI